jgi:hypothetical protein
MTIVWLRAVADGPELSESGRDGQGGIRNDLGIRGIEESSVYQDIFAKGLVEGLAEGRVEGRAEGFLEGRIEEARQAVLQLGRKKIGQPGESVRAVIATITDIDRLNSLLERILEVASWDELLTSSVSLD